MNEPVFKCKVQFGKIALDGKSRRNAADITMELKKRGGETTVYADGTPTGKTTPTYIEFTASGNVWNHIHTDIYMGGQCLDDMSKYIKTPKFKKILKWWKTYHLNGMNAGTPEQTAAIKAWEAAGNRYEYTAVCEMLKEQNLYEVPFYGRSIGQEYNGESYKYGHGWIISDIPAADLEEIAQFISTENGQELPKWIKDAIKEANERETRQRTA